MTAALLEKAGTALYGPTTWKHPLARDLGVSLRALRRWAAGENAVPDDYWPKLHALLIQHSLACRDLAVAISGATRPPHEVIRAKDGNFRNLEVRNLEIVTLAPDAGEGEV